MFYALFSNGVNRLSTGVDTPGQSGDRPSMRWDEKLLDLFEDLEQQAAGLHLAERDAEIADRSRSEYAGVTLVSRLHGSVGAVVTLDVIGVGVVEGTLLRVGADWCLIRSSSSGHEWIVALAGLKRAGGLTDRAVNEVARSVAARLRLGSALRGVADTQAVVLVHHVDGTQSRGHLARVGADFVELISADDHRPNPQGRGDILGFDSLAAIRRT